jgi:archaellin
MLMRKIYTLVLLSTSLILQTKSQNVGVGTATPASKLEIKGGGTTSATSALNVTHSGATS